MISSNSPRGDQPITEVTRPDGTPYRFELIHSDGATRTYGDTLVELVDGILPGYAGATDAQADALRLRLAVDMQVQLQARLAADEAIDSCSDRQREVLLGDRHEAVEWVGAWDAPVPLVLVDSFYEPEGPHVRPTGNVIWISPRDETTFLDSLVAAGIVIVGELA